MEADWSVEIGPDLPQIDATWEGFVDLQTLPCAIETVEGAQHPALRKALLALNANNSRAFTSKCDTWTLPIEEIDSDEFAASIGNARVGFASYIDILQRDATQFSSYEFHERRTRELASRLRLLAVQNGRVDLVLRAAVMNEASGYGVTLYAAGCGPDEASAYTAWQTVLAAAVAATIAAAAHPPRAGE
jgi:hypothetical protein